MTRVVLLGASNVTLGFGVISSLLRAGFPGPLDIRAALGHGRSYGTWSTLAFRSLPSIKSCGLWESLGEPSRRSYALLTDVGNDLMYGQRPEIIARWVETCLRRLSDLDFRLIVTRLPLARIERLTAFRYHATRTSFFPMHRPIAWPEMLGRARELDARVADAAHRYNASVVTPPLEWYGFDPIHIRWTRRVAAWNGILSHWPEFRPANRRIAAPGLSLLGRFPAHYRLLGRERTTLQPVTNDNGTTLSLF